MTELHSTRTLRDGYDHMTDRDLINNIHRRMDAQDSMLLEIRDKVTAQETMKPALDELVTLWKGSKILIPMMASMAGILWALWTWAKDHIK